jgi:hypothetical protein
MPTSEDPAPELIGHDQAPMLYADGIGQVLFGYPVSRLVLFSVVTGSDLTNQTPEKRRVTHVLSMPTINLLEVASQILVAVKNSESTMAAQSDQQIARLHELLRDIGVQGNQPAPPQ